MGRGFQSVLGNWFVVLLFVPILSHSTFASDKIAKTNTCSAMVHAFAMHLASGPMKPIPEAELGQLLAGLPLAFETTADKLQASLATYVGTQIAGGRAVEMIPPTTLPRSRSEVYMARIDGRTEFAVKVFRGEPVSLTRELASIHTLEMAGLKQFRPVAVQDVVRVRVDGHEYPVLVMTAASGTDVEELIRQTALHPDSAHFELLKEAISVAAKSLGEMHVHFKASHPDPAEVRFGRDYEIRRASVLLGADGVLNKFVQRSWMTASEYEIAEKKIQKIFDDYANGNIPLTTITHGDGNPGNFIYDPTTKTNHVIDLQTLIWSVDGRDPEHLAGSIDGSLDTGRFFGALDIDGIQHGLPEAAVQELQSTFMKAYAAEVGLPLEQVVQNVAIHRLRYFLRNVEDSSAQVYDDSIRQAFLDRLLKVLGARPRLSVVHSGATQFVGHGDAVSYESYFAGMDVTEQQKAALVTAWFPTTGTIADMGFGSPKGTQDLGNLFPGMEIVGVDIDPVVVEFANKGNQRPNVRYLQGDLIMPLFSENSLDGTINSSSLHEVNSFTGFDLSKVEDALLHQSRAVKPGKIVFVRDFIAPENGSQRIFLDLPLTDGKPTGEIPELSTAALFEIFARDFKSSVHRNGNIPIKKMASPHRGFVRFEVDYRSANEFVLRKDYRKTWSRELLEEYTYMSQSQFEKRMEILGLRVLLSKPVFNAWVIENRFDGKFFLYDKEGHRLPTPPSNYVIYGQKVLPHQAIRFSQPSVGEMDSPQYLRLKHYRSRTTGQIFDMASRPDQVLDLVPWFEKDGSLYVVNRHEYPRPIVGVAPNHLNRGVFSGHLLEPLTAVMDPSLSLEENALASLLDQSGIGREDVVSFGARASFYPSPGGIDELVHSQLVQVRDYRGPHSIPFDRSGFSESGFSQAMNAQQALRSCQVGGMQDARLEINIYNLLLDQKRSAGPWIGAAMGLSEQVASKSAEPAAPFLSLKDAADFEWTTESAGFLSVRQADFTEELSGGGQGKKMRLEYVVPAHMSTNTVSALLVVKSKGKHFIGLETRSLPAPQLNEGSPRLVTTPAFRLPLDTVSLDSAKEFLSTGLKNEFGCRTKRIVPLGGEYFVSPGITPEQVTPWMVEVDAADMATSQLTWVELEDLLNHRDRIRDAHLLTVLYRFAHAVGVIP